MTMETNWVNNHTLPLIAGTLLTCFLVFFLIAFVILYKRAQLKFELEKRQFEQMLLQTEIEIREQTLANVARELHDNIGQVASLVKINLSFLSGKLPNTEQQKMETTIQLMSGLIKDIKETSTLFNGSTITNMGLEAAIQLDVSRINRLKLLDIHLICDPHTIAIEANSTIFIYRMYQEIMNNILTHSQANTATIHLQQTDQLFLLTVADNGIGFQPESQNHGNGLTNLKERSKLIGARLNLESHPGQGTKISIALPLAIQNQ